MSDNPENEGLIPRGIPYDLDGTVLVLANNSSEIGQSPSWLSFQVSCSRWRNFNMTSFLFRYLPSVEV